MARKKYTAEQIINLLRKAEVEQSKGSDLQQVCRKLGIHQQTYYRWKKEYGGLKTSEVKKLKNLEKENSQLKKIVADLSLDNSILKELSEGKF